MAEKEEAEARILQELYFSRLPISLSTGSPATVPGVLGEWGVQGEGRPPRGFAASRGQDRPAVSWDPPCERTASAPAARSHVATWGLSAFSSELCVPLCITRKHGCGSYFRD